MLSDLRSFIAMETLIYHYKIIIYPWLGKNCLLMSLYVTNLIDSRAMDGWGPLCMNYYCLAKTKLHFTCVRECVRVRACVLCASACACLCACGPI